MLDSFFGFNGQSVKQLTYIGANKEISQSKYHRFEGFNNECDMETPYAYIYADRHDRLCEIVHECVRRSFGSGTGGLPGNNDSGGLSSCYVWNALGIFPVSGQDLVMLGLPAVEKAVLCLSNGRELKISVRNFDPGSTDVRRVTFNGREIGNNIITVREMMSGGQIEFEM